MISELFESFLNVSFTLHNYMCFHGVGSLFSFLDSLTVLAVILRFTWQQIRPIMLSISLLKQQTCTAKRITVEDDILAYRCTSAQDLVLFHKLNIVSLLSSGSSIRQLSYISRCAQFRMQSVEKISFYEMGSTGW